MLKKVLSQYKKLTALYMINGLIQIFAFTLSIVFFQKLIDSIIERSGIEVSLNLLIVYGILLLVDFLLSYLDNYPDSKLKNGFYFTLKMQAMEKLSKIDFLHYKKYGTGEIIQTVENGAAAGRDILFQFYLNIARHLLPELVFGMIFIGFYDLNILLIISISYIIVFIITKLLLNRLYDVKSSTLINEEVFTSKMVRSFMELVVFRINNRYKKEIEECQNRAERIIGSKTKILMIHELFFTSFAIIVAIIKVIAIYVGIKNVFAGVSSVGYIVAILALIDRIYEPIAIFNVEYIDYKLNKIAFERYERILNEPDDKMIHNGDDVHIRHGHVELCDVGYSFGSVGILHNLNMKFENGKKYLLSGLSGAGKTTILGLIAGLYKPDSGNIYVDGYDLATIKLQSYYKDIAYLTQTPPIFDGSIRENLVFDNDIDDKSIIKVLKQVNLYDDIIKKDEGLYEQIGEKGDRLSGGQKQRLAFARIILQEPSLIILDESTSAMDNINERTTINALFTALPDSSIIAVTHRLGTAELFDEIVLLGNGKVAAQGTKSQLLKSSELFRSVYKANMEQNE